MKILTKKTLGILAILLLCSESIFAQVLKTHSFNENEYKVPVFGYESESTKTDYRSGLRRYIQEIQKGNKIEKHNFAANPYIITGKTGSRNYEYARMGSYEDKIYHNFLYNFFEDTVIHEYRDFERYLLIQNGSPEICTCEYLNEETGKNEKYTAYQEFDDENRMIHLKLEKETEGEKRKEKILEVWVTYYDHGIVASYKDSDGQIYKFDEDENPLYIKYADKNEIWYTYDEDGHELSEKFSDGSSYKNIYEKSLLVKRVWNNGAENIFEYNKDGQLSHQYTTFPGVPDKLDEITYTYPKTKSYSYTYSIEQHSDGETFYVTSSEKGYKYTKIKEVKSINPEMETILYLPNEIFDKDIFNSYVPFYRNESIYLIPENRSRGKILKDGYIYDFDSLKENDEEILKDENNKRNNIFKEPYTSGPNEYSGSINGQFDIYHFYKDTYCIVGNSGILEGYIELPKEKARTSRNICFDSKGTMYGVISPEYIMAERIIRDDEDEDVPIMSYTLNEDSHGEIVKYSGYLTNFGYLNSNKVTLKKYPAASAKNLGTYQANTTFKILSQISKTEKINGKTGIWYKVRLTDGTEGYFFGPFVSRFE